jgi:ribosomal protein L33
MALNVSTGIAAPDITIVETALELKYALEEGHQDIEIREHVDLTGTDGTLHAILYSSTRSIRVRFSKLSILKFCLV